MKKLLVSVIGRLIANAGVQALMIVVVKIVGNADLGVGQVGKNRPLAEFEHLRFEAEPEAFGLGIVVAFALPGTTAAALRTHGPVLMQKGAVGVAAILAAAVGVDDKVRGRRLGEKSPL